jgi:ferritin-like metal-binding protein YciE
MEKRTQSHRSGGKSSGGGSSRGGRGAGGTSRAATRTRSGNGGSTATHDGFEKLFVDQVKDLYSAEKQLVKALPKMAKKASSEELRTALEEHLSVTEQQVSRLEQVFEKLDMRPQAKSCKGMAGLIEEGNELFEEDLEPEVLDCGIIGAAQKVEHYEIAAYGTLRAMAEQQGHREIAQLLQETLDEEKEADEKLTSIAENGVNQEASDRQGDTEEETAEEDEEDEER